METSPAVNIIVCSDRASRSDYEDKAGPAASQWLQNAGFVINSVKVIPDQHDVIKNSIQNAWEDCDVIILSGGTGISPTDMTPQVLHEISDYEVSGIGEQLRRESLKYSPNALLSRGGAWMLRGKLIYALPGNPKAVVEQLDILGDLIHSSVIAAKGLCQHRGHKKT